MGESQLAMGAFLESPTKSYDMILHLDGHLQKAVKSLPTTNYSANNRCKPICRLSVLFPWNIRNMLTEYVDRTVLGCVLLNRASLATRCKPNPPWVLADYFLPRLSDCTGRS